MDRVKQATTLLRAQTKILNKSNLKQLKTNLRNIGISKEQIDNFLVMTYKIINDLESMVGQRRPKNRIPDSKEYVRTIEFIRVIADTVARNILNEICHKPPSSSAATNNGAAEKILNDLRANDDLGTTDNPRVADIQSGVANAIIEILTVAGRGSFLELKAKMDPPVRVANVKQLRNDMADDGNTQRAHVDLNETLLRCKFDEARRNICPGLYLKKRNKINRPIFTCHNHPAASTTHDARKIISTRNNSWPVQPDANKRQDVGASADIKRDKLNANNTVKSTVGVKSKLLKIQNDNTNKVPADKRLQNLNEQTNKLKVETLKPKQIKIQNDVTNLSDKKSQNMNVRTSKTKVETVKPKRNVIIKTQPDPNKQQNAPANDVKNDNRDKLPVGKSPQVVNNQVNKTKAETVKPKTNVKKAVEKTRPSNNNQNKPDVLVVDKSNTKKQSIPVSHLKNDKTKVDSEKLTDEKSKQIQVQNRNNTNNVPKEKKPHNANNQTNKTKAEILQPETNVKKRVEKTRLSINNQNKPVVVAKPNTEKQDVRMNQVKNDKTKDNVDKLIDVKPKQNEIRKRDTNKVPAEKILQNTNDQTSKTKAETIKPKTNIKNQVEKTRQSINNNQNKPVVVAKPDTENEEDTIQVKNDKTKVDAEKLTHGKPQQIERHNVNVIRTNITKSETIQVEKNVTNSEEEVGITQLKNGTRKKLETMNLNTPVVKLKNDKSTDEEMNEKKQNDQGLILNSAQNAQVTELILQGTSGLSTEVDVDEVPDGDVRENAWEDNEGSSVKNRDMSAEHSRPTDVNSDMERHEQTDYGNGTEYSEDESQADGSIGIESTANDRTDVRPEEKIEATGTVSDDGKKTAEKVVEHGLDNAGNPVASTAAPETLTTSCYGSDKVTAGLTGDGMVKNHDKRCRYATGSRPTMANCKDMCRPTPKTPLLYKVIKKGSRYEVYNFNKSEYCKNKKL